MEGHTTHQTEGSPKDSSLPKKQLQLASLKKTPYVIAIITLLVVLVGLAVFWRAPQEQKVQQQREQSVSHQNERAREEWPVLWGAPDNQRKCQKNTSVRYSFSPIALEDIAFVEPIGELREGHIIPGDHGGFDYKTSPSSTPVKVFAPADGFLVGVEKHPYTPPPGYPRLKHYHVYLEHSCTLFTGFVHLTEFAQELLSASQELVQVDSDTNGQFKNIAPRIPVKAGQQIGTAWSFGLLGMVTVDLTVTNKGYLNPESYKGENWRVHSVAGLEYFIEPLKSQIMAKNPRTAVPRGGKIDFDIRGKLVGNWFAQGSGGFRDNKVVPKQCGNFPCPYWEGHLALVYDYIDPTQLRVSIGSQHGLSGRTPFGVRVNAPDFKTIGMAEGLVKYELVALIDLSEEKGYDTETELITINDESRILGTLLVQVIDNNTIKVEIFPEKTKEQMSGFSAQARAYTR